MRSNNQQCHSADHSRRVWKFAHFSFSNDNCRARFQKQGAVSNHAANGGDYDSEDDADNSQLTLYSALNFVL